MTEQLGEELFQLKSWYSSLGRYFILEV